MLKEKTRQLLEQARITRKRIISEAQIVSRRGRLVRCDNPQARINKARKAIALSLRIKRNDPSNAVGAVRAWRRAGGE